MSDQYPPQDPIGNRGGSSSYSTQQRADFPPRTPLRDTGTGLGTGIMVGGVFVVVAIMAVAFYSQRTVETPIVNDPTQGVVQSDGTAVPVPPEATPAIEPAITPDAPAVPITDPNATDAEATDPAVPAADPAQPAPATGGTTAPAP